MRSLPPAPLDRLHRADQRLFDAVHAAPLIGGRMLPRLSVAADHGLLWAGIAALLALAGGRRGRRAAVRGMGSLGLASAVVNLPFKGLTRRRRPSLPGIDPRRALHRPPRTTSFPSGHAASAAAFAAGAAFEMPALAVPLGALAGAVAYSRVHTGVHYPGDVLAGAASGAAAALLVRRLWPPAPDEAALRALTPAAGGAGVSPRGGGLVVVVNPASGPAYRQSPAAELHRLLPDAEVVELGEDADVAAELRRRAGAARALGVAGGDGSVNAAAAVAVEHDLPLLAVPAGTLNHLAGDLGLDSVAGCAEAVQRGSLACVDVAEIDGRPFLNTASLGAYVALVDAREALQGRIGKWPAAAVAAVRVLRRCRPVRVEIDGNPQAVWLLFLGNCRYGAGGVLPASRTCLDDGVIDVRAARADLRLSRLRLVVALLTGRPESSPVYRRWECREVRVRSLQGALRLSADGETLDGSAEPLVRKRERRLRMYASPRALSGAG